MNAVKFLALFILVRVSISLLVNRQANDEVFGKQCYVEKTQHRNIHKCTCTFGKTVLSTHQSYICGGAESVSCDMLVIAEPESNVAISGRTSMKKIPTGLPGSCNAINTIHAWNTNVRGTIGIWDDITDSVWKSFKLNSHSEIVLLNLDMTLLKGQLIMINVVCGKCVVIKFKGRIKYPFKSERFKSMSTVSSEDNQAMKFRTDSTFTDEI